MKIFGPTPTSNGRGETVASGEFSYHLPKKKNISGQARLEIDCFKKKPEFSRNGSFRIKRNESIGKSDSDSDYGSMPRDFDNDIWRKNTHTILECSANKLNSVQWKRDGFRVQLHPEEEWARNAKKIWWDIELHKFWKILCRVMEYGAGGVCVHNTEARISHTGEEIIISGKFKRKISPEFQLTLTSSLTSDDKRKEYIYVGTLMQGIHGSLEATHFAAVSFLQ